MPQESRISNLKQAEAVAFKIEQQDCWEGILVIMAAVSMAIASRSRIHLQHWHLCSFCSGELPLSSRQHW